MKNKIYIDVQQDLVKVALTEEGNLAEFHLENAKAKQYVGNVYRGRVVNVVQGMQAAFVDIGLEKNAYLFVGASDVDGNNDLVSGKVVHESSLRVREGEEIMVQVVKDPFGTKGVRVTQDVTLPGRYVVLMPKNPYVGISRKIEDDEKRARLISMAENVDAEGMGFIIRTAAEQAGIDEIKAEIKALIKIYRDMLKRYDESFAPFMVHQESDIVTRAVRDMLNAHTEEIIINDEATCENLREQYSYLMPKKAGLFRYVNRMDLLNSVGLSKEIEKILKRKVALKNGAYLVIDRTEALTSIDVNTGKFVGANRLEDTVFETNLVAADEIARQLRLRNVGGIIVVDFIDMELPEHREAVIDRLKKAVKRDRIKTSVIGMTGLGLLELTRKKARSDVRSILTKPCPHCHGDSVVLADGYVVSKVRKKLHAFLRDNDTNAVLVEVSTPVFAEMFASRALENECATMWASKRIYVLPVETNRQEEFSVKALGSGVISVPDAAKLLY